MRRLDGKTALITGAARGIGRAFAEAYVREGARVAIGDIDIDRARATAAEIGEAAIAVEMDVTRQDSIDAAVAQAVQELGQIDILINNAAIFTAAPIVEIERADFDRVFDINVGGTLFTMQAVARHMIARGAGKIINIASVQTALARYSIAPYTATKGAVGNLTKGMATDWARYGLQCNAVAPGYFKTPLNKALIENPEFNSWLESRVPAGRWGNVEELQGACIFLASEASSFVNGHVLYVDGGITVSL